MNIDSTLFNIDIPSAYPSEGKLLVAEPMLHGDIFSHSVVCLIDYESQKPSMGLIMNYATGYKLGELTDIVDESVEIPLFCGGPVENERLFYMHTLGDLFPGARQIASGLWIGGDFETVINYIRNGYPTEGMIRFFAGYSGWDPGQLNEEMKAHTWAVAKPMDPEEMLTGQGDAYWHRAVKSLGPNYKWWRMHPMLPFVN